MLPDVFRQVTAGHPFGNELEMRHGDTDEGDDVLVFQPLPHHGLFEERLWVSSTTVNKGVVANMAHIWGFTGTVLGIYPDAFDANPRIVEGPFVYVARASRSDRLIANEQDLR